MNTSLTRHGAKFNHYEIVQQKVGLCLAFLKEVAEKPHVDLRLEYGRETARKIMTVIENNPTVPLI